MSTDTLSAQQLRLFIERIERLEVEKAGIASDIKDVFAEAKGTGFDPKTIKSIIKLRKLEPSVRREMEALLDTYKAALGMLDGTPLGRWAVDRLSPPTPVPDDDAGDDDAGDDDNAAPPAPAKPEPSIAEAAIMGRTAAQAGKPVTANPFPPRDLRRAAWDEAWCSELGSDGMDIPDVWKPKGKKPAGEEGAE